MRVVALDFDGVIADSARESFVVALRAFTALDPSRVSARSRDAWFERDPAGHEFASDPTYRAFRALMPLGNRAEDYGVTLLALSEGADLPSQAAYDAYFARQDRSFLDAFHARFYREREALLAEDRRAWLSLQPPFRQFAAILARSAGAVTLAIATAKDRHSTVLLLEAYGIARLFAPELILDKEAGISKAAHLTAIRAALSCSWASITFVDDKVNHLEDVAPLGVRCVLAGWGYNGEREREAAGRAGFEVASLTTAETILFG